MLPQRRDAAQSLKQQPWFYRRMYRTVLRVVLWNSIILAGLCALTVYFGFYGFKPEFYFTTSPSGRILELPYSTSAPYADRAAESQRSQP